MQITILALGSRGDVQPFAALGQQLQQLGYRVCLAAATDYRELAEDTGLSFAPIVGSIREIMNFDLVYEALDAARQPLPLGFARRFLQHIRPLVHGIVADCLAASEEADALVVSTLGMYPGASIAERLRIPLVPAHFHPFAPTRAFPDMSFEALPSWVPGQGTYNMLTHHLTPHGMAQLLRPALNRARAELLDMPPLSPFEQWRQTCAPRPLTLYGYSQIIAPRPSDWDARQQITGYWFRQNDLGWQPPPDLMAFLEAGPPPVYVGFGSILAGRDPDQVTALIEQGLHQAGRRGVLFRGWGDLGAGRLAEHVFAIDSVPHSWLFPRMAAVVAHGGAGTVAAALRAGVPVVVVPFFGDQRFWAARIAQLHLGPPPVPRAQLNANMLAEAIRAAIANDTTRRRVRAVGALLEAEQGASRAARLIDQHLRTMPLPSNGVAV